MENTEPKFDLDATKLIADVNLTIGITLTEPVLTNYKEILFSEILINSENRAVVIKDGAELVEFDNEQLDKLFRILTFFTVRKPNVSKADIETTKQTCKIFVAKDLPMVVRIELSNIVYGVIAPIVTSD
jgi:hypothetical protein